MGKTFPGWVVHGFIGNELIPIKYQIEKAKDNQKWINMQVENKLKQSVTHNWYPGEGVGYLFILHLMSNEIYSQISSRTEYRSIL